MDEEIIKKGRNEVNAGLSLIQQGQKEDAGRHFMEALDCYESIQNPLKKREELTVIAVVFTKIGIYDLSLMAIQDAIELDKQLNDQHLLAEDIITLGNINQSLGNLQKAEESQREALKICLKNKYYDDAASASTNLATILGNQGRMDEAVKLLKNSLEYLIKKPFSDTEFNTRMMLIQFLGLRQQEPETIILNAKVLFEKYAERLHPDYRKVVVEYLDPAIGHYLQEQPQLDPQTWKQREFPWLFKP